MSKFKEIPRMYIASEVDTEIEILTQSRNYWKNKCIEMQKEIEKLIVLQGESREWKN